MIVNPVNEKDGYKSLIALAPTGCGKTGAFGVGSVLRIDRKND